MISMDLNITELNTEIPIENLFNYKALIVYVVAENSNNNNKTIYPLFIPLKELKQNYEYVYNYKVDNGFYSYYISFKYYNDKILFFDKNENNDMKNLTITNIYIL